MDVITETIHGPIDTVTCEARPCTTNSKTAGAAQNNKATTALKSAKPQHQHRSSAPNEKNQHMTIDNTQNAHVRN